MSAWTRTWCTNYISIELFRLLIENSMEYPWYLYTLDWRIMYNHSLPIQNNMYMRVCSWIIMILYFKYSLFSFLLLQNQLFVYVGLHVVVFFNWLLMLSSYEFLLNRCFIIHSHSGILLFNIKFSIFPLHLHCCFYSPIFCMDLFRDFLICLNCFIWGF